MESLFVRVLTLSLTGVAAQLQGAPRLPGHPPHQGIKPVDCAGHKQQGLVGQIMPPQVGQLVEEHHLPLVRREGPARQQKHRPPKSHHQRGVRLPCP